MYWYNPTTRSMEHAKHPRSDAQALAMLSGHPDSYEFIEVYRGWRITEGVRPALLYTGKHLRDTRGADATLLEARRGR
jgi:hypothetical protein